MLQRVQWKTRFMPAVAGVVMGFGLIMVTTGPSSADDSNGGTATHCDNKRSLLSFGWCPDTGGKREGAQVSRSRDPQRETPDEGESEADTGSDAPSNADRR